MGGLHICFSYWIFGFDLVCDKFCVVTRDFKVWLLGGDFVFEVEPSKKTLNRLF